MGQISFGEEFFGGWISGGGDGILTLPETNSLHLKMDGWNTTFLLGRPIFRGYVSFGMFWGGHT